MPVEGDTGQVLASYYCFPASPLPNPPSLAQKRWHGAGTGGVLLLHKNYISPRASEQLGHG